MWRCEVVKEGVVVVVGSGWRRREVRKVRVGVEGGEIGIRVVRVGHEGDEGCR